MSGPTNSRGADVADDQLIDIETKLAHQEYTIAELNDALTSQQAQIARLESLVSTLRERVKAVSEVVPSGGPEDDVPPHY